MFNIKKLTLTGFRSFSKQTTIEFPKTGLVSIEGDSGAGKTNIVLALAYALGYCPIPATALATRGAEKSLQVALEIETDNGPITINRGKVTSVVTHTGETVTGTDAVSEKIKYYTQLTPEILKVLTYRPQGEPGLFLSMNDAEKKEFLGGLLGLDKLDKAIEEGSNNVTHANVALAEAEQQKVVALTLQEAAQNSLSHAVPVAELPAPSDERTVKAEKVLNALLEAYKDAASAAQVQDEATNNWRSTAYADVNAQTAAANRTKADAMAKIEASKQPFSYDRTALDKLASDKNAVLQRIKRIESGIAAKQSENNQKIRILEGNVRTHRNVTAMLPVYTRDLEQNKARLIHLLASKCPTCNQEWHSEVEIDGTREKIADLEKNIIEADALIAKIESIDSEIATLRKPVEDPMLAKMNVLIQDITEKYLIEESNMKAAQTSYLKDSENDRKIRVMEVERQYKDTVATILVATAALDVEWGRRKAEVDTLRAKAESIKTSGVAARREYLLEKQVYKDACDLHEQRKLDWERLNNNLNNATVRVADTQKNVDAAQKALSLEKDYVELLKGFANAIFEEVLAEIAQEANDVIKSLPNVSSCTIDFKTDATTKAGKAKRSIVTTITIDGYETQLKHGCSGGMQTAIQLAVDLAVSAVVQRRTGVTPGWIVLDEAFDGFSNNVKEACLEVLKSYSTNKLMLVVSHAAAFREFFDDTMKVTLENGVSTVQRD